jgi:bacteriochlorophyll 4-vinyl reductase
MALTPTRQPELVLPAAALSALRDALVASVGPDAAAEALRAAGHAAGDAFHDLLSGPHDELGGLPADQFWARFAQLFASRGWGQLRYAEAHPGVGALSADDWVEARGGAAAQQPACHFTTGVLANLLGRVTGADVAVLEVECRARGDGHCRFLFGGAAAVYAVYDRLSAGDEPDAALAQIG